MSAPVRILLLGTPTVFYETAPLELKRRLPRTLLYYLACQRQPVSRAALSTVFWPDSPDEDGRKYLREALSRLRADLPDGDVLQVVQEQVSLDAARYSCDVREFQILYEETSQACLRIPNSAPLPEAVYQKMQRAVLLWRSDTFLDGTRLPESDLLETWLSETRSSLEIAHMRLLERLSNHSVAVGDLNRALHWLRTAAHIDPLNEELLAQILNLLLRMGRRSEALSQIQVIREQFISEGIDEFTLPLQAIIQKVREEASRPDSEENPYWLRQSTLLTPFVGRKVEMELLQRAVLKSEPVLVLGEAGSGKSRLVQELIQSMLPAPRLLAAPARPLEDNLPFQPLIDMLRYSVTGEEWRKFSKSWVSSLALLLPELVTLYPGLDVPTMPQSLAQTALFEAIHQLLLMLARSQRLLIFLDDLQWCDSTSLEALTYLLEHNFFGKNGALVISSRLEGQNSSMNRFIKNLPNSTALVKVILEPLTLEDVAQITRDVIHEEPSQALVERLNQDTGGNPLFLVETLHALMDSGHSYTSADSIDHLPLASSIQALVHERLQHLSPEAQQVLSAAAVIGRDIPAKILEETAHVEFDRMVDALEELERANLLRSNLLIQPAGGYSFIHDKIRDVVMLDLSSARRRLFNLRVANALDATGKQDFAQAAVVARHFEEAGESKRAFDYWLKAGTYAHRLYSTTETNLAYQNANRLLAQIDHLVPDEDIYRFYTDWGDFANDELDEPLTRQIYNSLKEIGFRRQNPLLVGAAFSGLAQAADISHSIPEGLDVLDRAIPFLEQAQNKLELVQAYNRRGGFNIYAMHIPEAVQAFEKAIELAGETQDPHLLLARAASHQHLSIAYSLYGWPVKALSHAEKAMLVSRAAMHHASATRAMIALSMANFYLGRYQVGRDQSLTGLRMAAVVQNQRLVGLLRLNLASCELGLGHLDEAYEQAHLAYEIAVRLGLGLFIAQSCVLLGDLYRLLGDLPRSMAYFQQGAEVKTPNLNSMICRDRMILCQTIGGQHEGGKGNLLKVFEPYKHMEIDVLTLQGLGTLTWVLLELGRSEEALAQAEQVVSLAAERQLPTTRAAAYYHLGRVALMAGRLDEARMKGLIVANQARELPNPLMELVGLQLARQAEEQLGGDTAEIDQQMVNVLDEMGQWAHRPELEAAFIKFRQQMLGKDGQSGQ